MPLDRWDECLASAVFVINNRIVRTHGYSPAQLLLGYTPKGHPEDFTFRDGILAKEGIMEAYMMEWSRDRRIEQWEELEEKNEGEKGGSDHEYREHVWAHLSALEERRMDAIEKMKETGRERELSFKSRHESSRPASEEGDLVLLRRSVVDKDKGRKLEPKWEGPYLFQRLTKSKVSAILENIHTGKIKGRHSLDSIKVYVQRKDAGWDVQGVIDISELRPVSRSWELTLRSVG